MNAGWSRGSWLLTVTVDAGWQNERLGSLKIKLPIGCPEA